MKNITLIIVSIVVALGGLHLLMEYSSRPGKMANSLSAWPVSSSLEQKSAHHLVMFLHPGCACSKASVAELSRLMSQASELTAQIVVMKSPKLEKLFSQNALLNQAKLIPRTKIIYDHDGKEAALFGAETSGLTHLYNSNAELLFAGGLTMARGHEGESVGKSSILALLKGQKSQSKSLVFGCDIFGSIKKLTMVQ